MSRTEAGKQLKDRIEYADNNLLKYIEDEYSLDNRRSKFRIWDDYNRDLLLHMFSDDSRRAEYDGNIRRHVAVAESPYLQVEVKGFHQDVRLKRDCLESIKNRLSFFSEPATVGSKLVPVYGRPDKAPKKDVSEHVIITDAVSCTSSRQYGTTIFLVHGRDSGAKNTVARFVEKLKLKVVILHEQPNEGRTIIEKFEHHCKDIGFAIILMTPDDVGGLATASEQGEQKPRARQNVILELGFFMGKLDRSRVAVLYKENVERPSDIDGVAYLPFDDEGAWETKLARELRKAGLPFDGNALL